MPLCYACDSDGNTKEHAPPKCFFPKQKDLQAGTDLRKNLITVPSCEMHNTEKSGQDEYFLNVVCACDQINTIGRNHYTASRRRAYQRNQSFLKGVASSYKTGYREDGTPGIAYSVDEAKLELVVTNLGRGIYLHHYNERWLNPIPYEVEFLSNATGDAEDKGWHQRSQEFDKRFSDCDRNGENPEVFYYQIIERDGACQMRVYFYEGCKILFEFRLNGSSLAI